MKRLTFGQHQRLSDVISFGPLKKKQTDQELINVGLIKEVEKNKIVFNGDPYEKYLNENGTIKDEWIPANFIAWKEYLIK